MLALTPAESRFALFLGCIVCAMAGGYLARRTGLVKIEAASGIMTAAIIGVDAPVALFALWFLQIHPGVWKVPVAGFVVAVLVVLVGLEIARRRGMAVRDRLVFALQSGMGNVGYTMGGAIAFAVWGLQGLAVEQMFCMMWPFFSFLFCWPLAHHYADPVEATDQGPRHADIAYALRILGKSLADLRSLPIYLATLGLILNLAGATPPRRVADWHVLDALMVIGIFMQFGSVGLTVRVSRLAAWWKPAVGSAALKFLLSPVLMLAAVLALGMTGEPLKVCLMLSFMPTALYSVLIANLFRLNTDLANTTFLFTTVFCLAVIVPAIALLSRAGLLT
jgi:predicted permease